MELTDILIDLSNSKAALEVANHTIRRMKGKCIRKNGFSIFLPQFFCLIFI